MRKRTERKNDPSRNGRRQQIVFVRYVDRGRMYTCTHVQCMYTVLCTLHVVYSVRRMYVASTADFAFRPDMDGWRAFRAKHAECPVPAEWPVWLPLAPLACAANSTVPRMSFPAWCVAPRIC